MATWQTRIGVPAEDALVLLAGFMPPAHRLERPCRPLDQHFRLQVPAPDTGTLDLALLLKSACHATLHLASGETRATFQLAPGEWQEVKLEAISPASPGGMVEVTGAFDHDPWYSPGKLVWLAQLQVEAEGELHPPAPAFGESVDLADYKVYFGDIHVHTEYSPCGGKPAGTIERNIAQAKERGLDFLALTDHAQWIKPADWERYFAEIARYSKEYELPVIPAVEYTSFEWGHRNVYMLTDCPPYFSARTYATNHPRKLHEFLREAQVEAFSIPHHPAIIDHLSNYDAVAPEAEPLLEIFSNAGSSEYYGAPGQEKDRTLPGNCAQDALARGYKFGFVAASDAHSQPPGVSGLTAVYARELTVESLFTSMKNKLCYACSFDKLHLEFEVNGFAMGRSLQANQYSIDRLFPLVLSGRCLAPKPLEKLEVISGGRVIYTQHNRRTKCEMAFKVAFDKQMTPDHRSAPDDQHLVNCSRYYYLRATMQNGSQAWSSPVFVDFKPNLD